MDTDCGGNDGRYVLDRIGKEIRHRLYKGRPEGEHVELHVRQIFSSIHAFRICLKDYAIQEGVILNRVKNERIRITTICALPNCE